MISLNDSSVAHQKYTLSDVLFHETCFFFSKRSGAVVMSPDSEGLDAAVVAGVGPGSATITNRSPSHQEEEEIDKTKQAQIEQTYVNH